MSEFKKMELVFIPFPIISHTQVTIKTANLLLERDERLSITVLILKLQAENTSASPYTKNHPDSRIKFMELPDFDFTFPDSGKTPIRLWHQIIESQTGAVRNAVAKLIEDSSCSMRLVGFVIDMFCTSMIDVANEFGVPSYVHFTCSSASLGLMFRLQSLRDDFDQDLMEYEDSDVEVSVPTFVNSVSARVLPSSVFEKENGFVDLFRKFRETKGIVINTFLEFEPHAIKSLSDEGKIPPVYAVGPVVEEVDRSKQDRHDDITSWLDEQPNSSVVFLCFGTFGYFEEVQVKEIASALEKSGLRFLWSLRKPPPKEKRRGFPGEYENPEEVLPKGFLERTSGNGKVIGWAPQMAVLSHRSVGGFVSHCGWNSILESVWCGVPVAVWPFLAEQQVNAFQLVREFGVAVDIKMDYMKGSNVIVKAEKIEKAIRELMDPENEIRIKVKKLGKESRMALMEGGSSYDFLDRFIHNIFDNVS